MDVTYAIVKVYVTGRYDVIKRHSNVITICERQQLKWLHYKKNIYVQKWKLCKKKKNVSIMGGRER